MTQDKRIAKLFPEIRQVEIRPRVHDMVLTPGVVGSGGNSGFQACNVALHCGARRLILVGYDCTLRHGAHWHGRHSGLNNPTQAGVDKWKERFDAQAPIFAKLGVEVLNASKISALEAYPKMTLEEALSR